MNRSDLGIGLAFLLLGAVLWICSGALPPGVGGLPGPGFFPRVIGIVMLALASLLMVRARSRPEPFPGATQSRPVIATLVLLAAYLALWHQAPFALRTLLFVVVYLRCLGQSWRAAVRVALGLTLFVVAAFQYGLRVGLP